MVHLIECRDNLLDMTARFITKKMHLDETYLKENLPPELFELCMEYQELNNGHHHAPAS